ncbi:helix-turn-helix domain-containing protein [Streptomyces sp. NBC_01262]|uniref:helix-turn-helix domain-containing protein n=1 Tax=Streptomyces sp. NBC_01262 TaxID=2903803 RepID=UPI002E363730|nr:helix-turn-helix transcriptional regulator [Streptomyces sp. NBC_01262]
MATSLKPPGKEPSLFLRHFGGQVRILRERRGLTRDELGGLASCSGSLIGAIERGERIADPDFAVRLDTALVAEGLLASAGPALAAERYPPMFRDFALLEADCFSFSTYAPHAVPGLLKTESYAHALIGNRIPSLDDDETNGLVKARLDRQALLARTPKPVLTFAIEEAVLRRPFGGRVVLKEQLLHLLACSRLRHVSVQVMPIDCEEHAGTDGLLTLLETKDRRPLAYTEGQGGSTLISDRDQVSLLIQRYGAIRAQALTPRESARYIEQLVGAL